MKKVSLVLSLAAVILGFTGVAYMSKGLFAQSFMDLGAEYKAELGKMRLDISRLGEGKISDFHTWSVKIANMFGFPMEPRKFLPEKRETHALSVLGGFAYIAGGALLQVLSLLAQFFQKKEALTMA